MILAGKYEQLDRVGGAAIPAQRARDIVSGSTVYLHRLASGSPQAVEALKLALQYSLKFPANGVLLDLIEESDGVYVVTDDRPEHAALLDFLLLELSAGRGFSVSSPGAPPRAVQRPLHASAIPGEFTELFRTRSASSPVAPAPPISEESTGGSPSEFTQMFKAPKRSGLADEPFPALAMPGSPGPNEFARQFSADPTAKPEHPAQVRPILPPLEANDKPGEFTHLFKTPIPLTFSPPSGSASLLEERVAQPAFPANTAPGPGEYTRVVRSGKLPAESASGTLVDQEKPTIPSGIPNLKSAPVPAAPPALTAPTFKSPEVPTAALQKPDVKPMLILVGVVLLAAMALIIFFVLRR